MMTDRHYKTVYPALSNWMRENGVTKAELACRLGVSFRTVCRWMRGDNSIKQAFIDDILSTTSMKYEDAFKRG